MCQHAEVIHQKGGALTKLVSAAVKQRVVVIETLLRAIAMMHVKVLQCRSSIRYMVSHKTAPPARLGLVKGLTHQHGSSLQTAELSISRLGISSGDGRIIEEAESH